MALVLRHGGLAAATPRPYRWPHHRRSAVTGIPGNADRPPRSLNSTATATPAIPAPARRNTLHAAAAVPPVASTRPRGCA